MFKTTFVIIAVSLSLICGRLKEDESDIVYPVPKIDYTLSKVYSGYLEVRQGIKFHYILVESQGSPSNDPLVLWLNGGPGCSSHTGFTDEVGPFVFNSGTKNLELNQYTWAKSANLLFIESPAGVGFSTYENPDEINTDDIKTGDDNLLGLLAFFKKFPQYEKRDLFLTGESYSGIYIPHLASNIITYNNSKPSNSSKINVKGILLGNPVTDWTVEGEASMIQFAWDFALYSAEQRTNYEKYCLSNPPIHDSCVSAKSSIYDSIKGIFVYDIYRKCYKPKSQETNQNLQETNKLNYLSLLLVCDNDDGATNYYNDIEVKKAYHVDETIQWKNCNMDLFAKYNYSDYGSFYLYSRLISYGLRIMIFSGDTDSVVATTGTKDWIRKLNLQIKNPWRQWSVNGFDISGFVEDYNQLSFVTFRGVGHMVPQWKREESLYIFEKFINNLNLS